MPEKKPTPKSNRPPQVDPLGRMLRDPYANETPEEWRQRTEREKREFERSEAYDTGGGTRGFSSGLYGAPQGPETAFIQNRENTLNALYAMLTGKGAPREFVSNRDKYIRSKY